MRADRRRNLWAGFLSSRSGGSTSSNAGSGSSNSSTLWCTAMEARWIPLISSFDQQRRSYSITSRRRMLQNPEHRLFLALLLNLPDRRSVDAILGQRFPEHDPGVLLFGG